MNLKRLIVASGAVLSMCVVHAETYTWTGGTGTWDENSGAHWTASDQSTGVVPGENDAVIIPGAAADYTVTVTKPFSVASLEVGSTAADTAVTLCFSHREENTVSGNVAVRNGATITHTELPALANTPAQESYRVALVVGGNMIIDERASVNVDEKGYAKKKGPGRAAENLDSPGHGGSSLSAAACYGSLVCPTNCGSGSRYSPGGGSVRLAVRGSLTVNGSVTATTADCPSIQTSGAGGSIWLTCADLLGSGVLNVAAGYAQHGDPGGGGRIAVHLTEATDFSSWQGHMMAHGGAAWGNKKNSGGAGTIYLQAAGQTPATATVVLDDEGAVRSGVVQTFGYTLLSDRVDAGVIGNLIVTNHAQAAFAAEGETSRIYGNIDTTTGGITEYTGTAELAGSGTQTIRGDGAWDDLSCTESGKTIKVGTGAGDALNFRVTSVITLAGSDGANIVLTPEIADGSWKINLPVGGTANISYVTVDHSDASGGIAIATSDSTDGGDNVNWMFSKPIEEGDPITWTGAQDSDWNKVANWKDKYDESRTPVATDKVVIPAGCENYPTIITAASYWGLEVADGATLTIAAGPVVITDELTIAGRLVFTGYQTLEISAPTASFEGATLVPGEGMVRILDGVETFNPGGCTFCRVEIPRSGGTLELADGLKAKSFEVRATAAATVVFAAGATIEADTVVCSCNAAANGTYLTLESSVPETPWLVKSPRVSYMTCVSVSDSTASDAKAVASLSVNGGRNTNWSFDDGVSEWVGGTGDFDVAANWYPAGVPGATSDVLVRGAATITANGNVSVRSLSLLPDTATASFTVKGILTTAGDVVVGTNATLTLSTTNEFNEIGGDFVVCSGGTVTHPALAANATTLEDGENGAKVIVRAQNIVVEAGGSIDATGKGYAAKKGPAVGGTYQDAEGNSFKTTAGHAGTIIETLYNGATTNAFPVLNGYRAYGSMFEPTTYGSGGNGYSGGGVIRLVALGNVTVDGTVCADGGKGCWQDSGAGGSVWITADGRFGGAGLVSVRSAYVDYSSTGSGGRIAVYAGQNDFHGRLSASGLAYRVLPNKSESSSPATGTVLMKVADEENYSLVLDYDEYESLQNRIFAEADGSLVRNATDIPTAEDLDKIELFKKVSVACGHLAVFNLTRDLKIYDLDFSVDTASKARLNFHSLEIADKTHKKGRGWAVKTGEEPLAAHIWPCENDAGAKGDISWPSGLAIIVR